MTLDYASQFFPYQECNNAWDNLIPKCNDYNKEYMTTSLLFIHTCESGSHGRHSLLQTPPQLFAHIMGLYLLPLKDMFIDEHDLSSELTQQNDESVTTPISNLLPGPGPRLRQ